MALLKPALPVALLFVALPLAGCLGDDLGESGINSSFYVDRFGNFTWSRGVATDGFGNILETHELFRDPAATPQIVFQLVPKAGPEPNIAVNDKGTIFVSTLDNVQVSRDHGATWKIIYDYTSLNFPNSHDRTQTFDPLLWMDPDTDRVFVAHLQPFQNEVYGGPWCVYVTYTDDEGKTWSDEVPRVGPGVAGAQSCMIPIVDHQKLASGKPGPKMSQHFKALRDANPNKWQNVVYMCHNKYEAFIPFGGIQALTGLPTRSNPIFGTWCEVSFDSGRTFQYAKQLSPLRDGCAGVQGHPAVAPDGTVAVALAGFPHPTCGQEPLTMYVSEDSGETWVKRVLGNDTGQMEVDPDITFTPDGTGYVLFRNKHQHMFLARSKDKFATWEGPWRVSPPDHTLNVFAGITSGDNGRIAMSYLGTVTPQEKGATPSNATGGTLWNAYVTYSLDADAASPTFYTQQVNPSEDPVQVGCVWLLGGPGGPFRCRNLLDFIDTVSDSEGRFFSVVTDGCDPRNGCTIDTDAVNYQSRDRQAAVIVQDGGVSLLKEKGNLGRYWLQPPQPFPR